MRFSSVVAVLAAPLLALAQEQNPFKVPTAGYNTAAGQTLTLNWTPTTSGTVSLYVREGAASNLNPGTEIATNIQNSGSFAWTVPSNIVRGSDYAIEIRSSTGSNYTPQFVIDSSNTVASTTATSGSTTATGSSTTGSSTGSSSTDSSSTTTGKSSSSTGSSSSSGSVTSHSTASNTATSSASFQSTSASKGSAPRATAAAGMMGLVALGALAL
ncbi:hypothetical protein K461DRAFT_298416 [Myriangium duriaei CBS 260.36]|uniref:Yeast cell wall synthesis Kre9/Knh1-like N-terminal domain-containing protein n=1 Tax=Myriangium duriaei CBS 260.36 TaxID=1168546 RepID=A0A9P4IT17_9PEZI|nr:hypothetical protein K461DRAFT_298416 [Myriangium duriaei CBS 260.36]